jgi:hypothetical protein
VELQELFLYVPTAIGEMQREFFRVGGEHFDRDMNSQHTACFMLGIRSASLLTGMGKMLQTDSFDSYDVLQRAFLETRDLLTTFRFDQDETRARIKVWFIGKDKAGETRARRLRALLGKRRGGKRPARKEVGNVFSALSPNLPSDAQFRCGEGQPYVSPQKTGTD